MHDIKNSQFNLIFPLPYGRATSRYIQFNKKEKSKLRSKLPRRNRIIKEIDYLIEVPVKTTIDYSKNSKEEIVYNKRLKSIYTSLMETLVDRDNFINKKEHSLISIEEKDNVFTIKIQELEVEHTQV